MISQRYCAVLVKIIVYLFSDIHAQWVGTYDDNEIETHIKDMKNGYRFVVKLKKSIIVNSIAYMQSFWARMMEQCDVEIIRQKVENLSDISSQFDVVILATGADVIRLWGYQLPLTLIRGRNLIYNAEDVTWLSKYNALIVDKYAIHQPDIGEVVCGSTYEYSADPDTHPYDGMILILVCTFVGHDVECFVQVILLEQLHYSI